VRAYEIAIRRHLMPALGGMPLQALRADQIARYYRDKAASGLSSATLQSHAAVLGSALASAVRQEMIERNPASLVDGKPRARRDREDVKENCWDRNEVRTFLRVVTTAGPQLNAFFNVALDTGARRGELQALRWADVDLDAGTVLIDRTLVSRSGPPVYGPTKSGKARTLDLNPTTVALLRTHRSHQAEVRMANRLTYGDFGLVFGREWDDVNGRAGLGEPLSGDVVAKALDRIGGAASVRRITPHGLRHTSATLLLTGGIPPHIVAKRLGHANAIVTMQVYAHALRADSREAALMLGGMLHGNG